MRNTDREIHLPRAFYWDHFERDLPTPKMIQSNKAHIVVSADDPAVGDLLSDAEFYADRFGPDCTPGLKASARATVAKIKKALA